MLRALLGRLSRILEKVDGAPLARPFLNAPVAGALYLGLLYLSFVTKPLVPADQVLFGRDAKEIADYVAVRFAPVIRHVGLELGGLAIGIGAALGVLALLLFVLRDFVRGARPARRTGLRAALLGLLLVALLHAFAVFVSMSKWPQLYAAQFWSQGGALAFVQRLVTDRLRTQGLVALFCGALAIFVAGPPWAWGRVARRARRRPRAAVAAFVIVAALALVVRLSLREPPPIAPSSSKTTATAGAARRRSVLVIASDGLRPDRLRPEIAPRLSALAARGTVFDRAYVDIPRTMSSWATLLTGLHPHHHGVRSGFPPAEETEHPLDSLPARLRALGYRTAAVSDYVGEIFGRVDFGFEDREVPPADFASLIRERAVERSTPLLPFLQTRAGRAFIPEVALWSGAADPRFIASTAVSELRKIHDDPFFMVVFFSTTHFPYAAPAPYHARFTRPDYEGPFRYDKTVMSGVPLMPNAADVQQIRGLYDGAVAAVDDAVGTILDEVQRLGASEDLIIVITSDHGELLFENDRWHGHGDHLFGDQATHIPLTIVDPRAQPRVEHAVVSSVDLAPTLYDVLGVPPPSHLDGRSLAPAIAGKAIESEPAYAETELWLGFNPGVPDGLHLPPPSLARLLAVDTDHGNVIVLQKPAFESNLVSRHRMVRDDRWKLLYMPTPKGIVYRLYDTSLDPDELTDVLAAHPAEAERLKALLWAWMLEDTRMTRDGEWLVVKGTRAPVQAMP